MPDEASRIHFIADRGDARLRLDQVLVRRLTDVSRMSRSRAQQWIECGAVSVDQVPATRPSQRVREGAAVEVTLPDTVKRRAIPAAEERTLDVLYEDDHLLALNKPAGVVVHPSYKNASGTLLNAVLWHVRDRAGVQPGIVTRLDKDTSGVLLIAKSPSVHARLQRAMHDGALRKIYLALVFGRPQPAEGIIDLPLGRDPNDRRRMIVDARGQASTTLYRVIATHPGVSLLECELVTGRTHQIRAHLAARDWPIVGDRAYGEASRRDEIRDPHWAATISAIDRQALHAWQLVVPHPLTRERLHLVAPPPEFLCREWEIPFPTTGPPHAKKS